MQFTLDLLQKSINPIKSICVYLCPSVVKNPCISTFARGLLIGAGLQQLSVGSNINRKTRPYKASPTV
jgi:hypothetical protein